MTSLDYGARYSSSVLTGSVMALYSDEIHNCSLASSGDFLAMEELILFHIYLLQY